VLKRIMQFKSRLTTCFTLIRSHFSITCVRDKKRIMILAEKRVVSLIPLNKHYLLREMLHLLAKIGIMSNHIFLLFNNT